MAEPSGRAMRGVFFGGLVVGLRTLWPVISGILLLKAGLGAVVGMLEGWGIGAGIYFAFVTGLTIGYGDLAPTGMATRAIAVAIGFVGIVLTGLVAALAVSALDAARRGPGGGT